MATLLLLNHAAKTRTKTSNFTEMLIDQDFDSSMYLLSIYYTFNALFKSDYLVYQLQEAHKCS